MSVMDYFVWGAKGHAKILNEIVQIKGGRVKAIFDSDNTLRNCINLDVRHGLDAYINWAADIEIEKRLTIGALVAIGGANGSDRHQYYQRFNSDGFLIPILVHPAAWCSKTAEVGSGTQVCAFGFIGADAKVGEACIINTKSSVDHDSIIGNGVHLGPGATVCGNVGIGDYTFIGSGSTVLPNLKIGKNCTVGAGAVVVNNLADNTKVKGVPAVAY